jgi:exodeoxyribonuclease-3
MYKIATFNVNSIKARLAILTDWLQDLSPDVVLLQELKCTELNFPHDSIADLGYNVVLHGQKTYNGVAILSKTPIEDWKVHFPDNPDSAQARFLEADSYLGTELYKFICLYVPNGQDINSEKFSYKLDFLQSLYSYLKDIATLDQKIIIGGDFNVALSDLDVYDKRLEGQVCYHPLERQWMRKIINLGFNDIFRDFNPNITGFTWWDYRAGSWQQNKGMRIDYLLLNHWAAQSAISCVIDDKLRALQAPSDHAPVVLEIRSL